MTKLSAPLQRLAVAAALLAIPTFPQAAVAIPRPEQAKIVLNADRTAYEPGSVAHVSALVSIAPGW
ncbi:MAG TPA: hypothetical protein VGE98_05545, partial [Thermoanaerobaculia bacterium]